MAWKKDYYRVLGISRDVTSAEIRKAYLRLAHEWHPDKNPGNETVAEEVFKEIGEAYAVLSDEQSRQAYDTGVPLDRTLAARRRDVRFYHDLYRTVSADPIKESFMSFMQVHREMLGKGLPIRMLVRVLEQELMNGTTLKLRVNRREPCKMCRGTGEIKVACCPDCRGTARKKYESIVAVVIPPGTRHGDVITLKGEGNAGFKGFPAGDLIICIIEEVIDRAEETLIGH